VIDVRSVIFVLLLVGLLAIQSVAFAADGYVAANYDALLKTWVWELSVHKDINSYLRVGTTLKTHGDKYAQKTIVPSFIPTMQGYEVWAEIQKGDFSVRITDWCDHWLSQSGVPSYIDDEGLKLRVQYNF
jgi:hypothetical protein